jgi:hypothetical protein
MKQQNRKILMIMDNCPAYPKVENLSNVTVKFLPPNVTSVLQPLDQGIIKNFKALCRKLLLTCVVANSNNFQSITEFSKSINVLHAVLWIADAWVKVNPESVTKCFAKAGFVFNCFASDQQENMTEDLLRLKIDSLLDPLPSCKVTSSEIIEMDNDIPVFDTIKKRM